jgi:hypothetical protein
MNTMMKCPFCQFDNEDGALFCEQCKSDLGMAPTAAITAPGEAVPMAAFVEETEPMAQMPLPDVPMAAPFLGEPAETVPVAESPFDFTQPAPPAVPLARPVRGDSPAATPPPAVPAAVPVAPAETVAAPVAETVQAAPPASPSAVPVAEPAIPLVAPAAAATAVPPADLERLPPGAQPKLVVQRGQKIDVEFPIYEGHNFIGRADEKPVDIDLEDQEPADRIWSSRQHAVITFEDGKMVIEDLNSANGTFVNRSRIHPGQKRALKVSDVIQIGTVQLKVKV